MNEKLNNLIAKLKEKNIEFRLTELSDKAFTVEDVVKYSKGELNQNEICKTIVAKTGKGYVGLFLKGDKRINFDRVQKILNSKVRIATKEEVEKTTGLELGTVSPLFLDILVVMDNSVFDLEKVNFGSGDHFYEIEMKPQDLLKISNAKIAKISE